MSQNVDRWRGLVEAYKARDIAAFIA